MKSSTTSLKLAAMGLVGALHLSALATAGTVYIPKRGEWMWDTWVMQDGADYHLFHLSKEGGLGRAVSQDLIHWTQLPMIPNLAKPGDWDEKGMLLTGSTVKFNGKYYVSYGSKHPEPLGFLVSNDLKNWSRLGAPVLPSKEPYKSAWRDLSNYWDPTRKLWDGYLCAEYNGRPCVGHVSSPDLLHWSYHTPMFVSEPYTRDNNGFVEFEVPDQFEMDGKYYITYSSAEYEQLVHQFNPGNYDADAWVRLAKDAGMKYIVITTKHHDGFCLWDSAQTAWDVGSTPYQKDLLKPLAEACATHGIRLCFYHSIMD